MISAGAGKQVKTPPSYVPKLSAPSRAELIWIIEFASQGFSLNILVNNARLSGRRLSVPSTPLEYRKVCQPHEYRFRNSFNTVIYFKNGSRSHRFFSTLIFSFVCYMIPKSYRSFHVSSIYMYSITFNCFAKFPRYAL